MPIETITHNGNMYPAFQASGFAARFAFPFAVELCKGVGYDIGCNRDEWKLPNAFGIDKGFYLYGREWDATHLPQDQGNVFTVDYIFSSHCLEHIPDWVGVLNHWAMALRPGGVLFLYLPHPDQSYWRPWYNRKHVNVLHPDDVYQYLTQSSYWVKAMVSGRDLNHSFYAVAQRI